MFNDLETAADAAIQWETVWEKWGPAADAGFVALPNALIRSQARLGLSANDLVVLLNILMHWFKRAEQPRPRATAIAKRTGLGNRTVQRSLQNLERKGLIGRISGPRGVPQYDLEGLRNAVAEAARADEWYQLPAAERQRRLQDGQGSGLQNPTP